MKYDFKRDWTEYVKNELTAFGYSYDKSKSLTINSERLFNLRRRIPSTKPREIIRSKEFSCPAENQVGLKKLESEIKNGKDIRYYLSKGITNLDYNDKTLDEWGIHHLHLGTVLEKKFVKRTKNVVFVIFLDSQAVFLTTLAHGKGHSDVWVNTTLIEIVHNNWPEIIEHLKMGSASGSLTPNERINLRKINTNVSVTISDGTCYCAPGGGFMSNGTAIADFNALQKVYRDLDYFEKLVTQEKAQIENKLNQYTPDIFLGLDFKNVHDPELYEKNSGVKINLE
ncbi:hypothetical protein KUV44_17610 [Marinobacter daepoensis]|uniref:Uncharacterized protein n=1 Tax=Marinobacter daepoensis TaxID=262077 RepID=A0ABS3BGK1_9GAMM|nr:hypothetical protein [Marinobacter daepoensis]MBN7769827.1 hypothetical protein [Marinobacter daepoensis]MBY6080961.1 hypothetical protein [Marinobacter daepoensis]